MSETTYSTEHVLHDIKALIQQRSGISFDSSSERFFSGRISEFLQAKNLENSEALMRLLVSSNVEYQTFLQRLLTQETSFFRYPDAFQALKKLVLPELHARKFWSKSRSLRIWSAGCSTGEEPYSIAITVAESFASAKTWDIEILATDISRQALDQAMRASYTKRRLGNITQEQLLKYFAVIGDSFELKPNIRQMVSFVSMNLAQSLYVGRMDCIFCMNVLIYFAEDRRNEVLRTFYNSLEPGGYLFLGHSETVGNLPVELERIVLGDCLLYRKPRAGNGVSNSGSAS